jgi:hypothetical protein
LYHQLCPHNLMPPLSALVPSASCLAL